MKNKTVDQIRKQTLDSTARNEFLYKFLIVACAIFELIGFGVVLLLTNWSDPTHRLIFAATMLVYITLGLWVWAIAARDRVGEQRILRAIENLNENSSRE